MGHLVMVCTLAVARYMVVLKENIAMKRELDERGGSRRMSRSGTLLATIDGVHKPVMEHCTERGLKYNSVIQRIKRGMTPEDAILVPWR
jgi:hypothetical protein